MGIFNRFRDIVGSNINAMLEKAEDPEKLIRLMIHEMEETLIDIKASCAGVMADSKRIKRQLDEAQIHVTFWEEKAPMAVNKGRDDLAREALMEKRKHSDRAIALEKELKEYDMLIEEYHEDIRELEGKLRAAREKQRMLFQRHIYANDKMRTQQGIHRIDSTEAMLKFDELENRIELMEAEAELINFGTQSALKEELYCLSADQEIEDELRALRATHG